jgi:hypothetical protein
MVPAIHDDHETSAKKRVAGKKGVKHNPQLTARSGDLRSALENTLWMVEPEIAPLLRLGFSRTKSRPSYG